VGADTFMFRSLLYLFSWLGGVVILIWGDFMAIATDDMENQAQHVFWTWLGLCLWAGPMAFAANVFVWRSPRHRYRGMWLRLGSDIGQLSGIICYLLLRILVGDTHIYSSFILMGVAGYVIHLIFWDIHQLVGIEMLAHKLEKKKRASV